MEGFIYDPNIQSDITIIRNRFGSIVAVSSVGTSTETMSRPGNFFLLKIFLPVRDDSYS